jgi:hypothetical protein
MSNLDDLNWVIAKPESYGVWSFYPDQESARADLEKLTAEKPEEFQTAQVMLFDDWHSGREESYLSAGIQEIDEETYYDMLGVLPPLQWRFEDGVDRFCMSEFTIGRITTQYGRVKRGETERFFCKPVRFNDKSTYITIAAIEAFDAARKTQA